MHPIICLLFWYPQPLWPLSTYPNYLSLVKVYEYHYSCEQNAEGLDGVWGGIMEGEAEKQLKLHVEVFILWDFLSDPSMSPP